MLGVGERTGSELEKVEKGFGQGHGAQVSSRNVNGSGGSHLLEGNALPEVRAGSRLSGEQSSQGLCLCPVLPHTCSQASGVNSLVPTVLAPHASLVPGHLPPLLPALLLTVSASPWVCLLPAQDPVEAQTLSSADEARV